MRLWKLDELQEKYPNDQVIHECEHCGWRTPILMPLRIRGTPIEAQFPKMVIVRNNLCDQCNSKPWIALQRIWMSDILT